MRDPHDVLGIRRGSSTAEVRAAYRRLARARHPDTPGGSEAAMRELNAAYAALRRDSDGDEPGPPPPSAPARAPAEPTSRRGVVVVAAIGLLVTVLAALAATGSDTVPEPAAAELVAAGRRFAPGEVRLRADAPVQLRLVNRDVGYRHNVLVTLDGVPVARGEPYTGPSAVAYDLGPLPVGTYGLRCEVYRSMTARLVVSRADR